MKKLGLAIWMVAGSLVTTAPAMPEAATVQGEGKAIVTVLPKKDREAPVNVTLQDVQAKVNGRDSNATGWVPLRGSDGRLELVYWREESAGNAMALDVTASDLADKSGLLTATR